MSSGYYPPVGQMATRRPFRPREEEEPPPPAPPSALEQIAQHRLAPLRSAYGGVGTVLRKGGEFLTEPYGESETPFQGTMYGAGMGPVLGGTMEMVGGGMEHAAQQRVPGWMAADVLTGPVPVGAPFKSAWTGIKGTLAALAGKGGVIGAGIIPMGFLDDTGRALNKEGRDTVLGWIRNKVESGNAKLGEFPVNPNITDEAMEAMLELHFDTGVLGMESETIQALRNPSIRQRGPAAGPTSTTIRNVGPGEWTDDVFTIKQQEVPGEGTVFQVIDNESQYLEGSYGTFSGAREGVNKHHSAAWEGDQLRREGLEVSGDRVGPGRRPIPSTSQQRVPLAEGRQPAPHVSVPVSRGERPYGPTATQRRGASLKTLEGEAEGDLFGVLNELELRLSRTPQQMYDTDVGRTLAELRQAKSTKGNRKRIAELEVRERYAGPGAPVRDESRTAGDKAIELEDFLQEKAFGQIARKRAAEDRLVRPGQARTVEQHMVDVRQEIAPLSRVGETDVGRAGGEVWAEDINITQGRQQLRDYIKREMAPDFQAAGVGRPVPGSTLQRLDPDYVAPPVETGLPATFGGDAPVGPYGGLTPIPADVPIQKVPLGESGLTGMEIPKRSLADKTGSFADKASKRVPKSPAAAVAEATEELAPSTAAKAPREPGKPPTDFMPTEASRPGMGDDYLDFAAGRPGQASKPRGETRTMAVAGRATGGKMLTERPATPAAGEGIESVASRLDEGAGGVGTDYRGISIPDLRKTLTGSPGEAPSVVDEMVKRAERLLEQGKNPKNQQLELLYELGADDVAEDLIRRVPDPSKLSAKVKTARMGEIKTVEYVPPIDAPVPAPTAAPVAAASEYSGKKISELKTVVGDDAGLLAEAELRIARKIKQGKKPREGLIEFRDELEARQAPAGETPTSRAARIEEEDEARYIQAYENREYRRLQAEEVRENRIMDDPEPAPAATGYGGKTIPELTAASAADAPGVRAETEIRIARKIKQGKKPRQSLIDLRDKLSGIAPATPAAAPVATQRPIAEALPTRESVTGKAVGKGKTQGITQMRVNAMEAHVNANPEAAVEAYAEMSKRFRNKEAKGQQLTKGAKAWYLKLKKIVEG